MGWSITGNGSGTAWLVGSGPLADAALAVDTTTGAVAEQAISGLTSGSNYNVVVQCSVSKGSTNSTVYSTPKTSKAD